MAVAVATAISYLQAMEPEISLILLWQDDKTLHNMREEDVL